MDWKGKPKCEEKLTQWPAPSSSFYPSTMFLGLTVLMNWQLHKECSHEKPLLSGQRSGRGNLWNRENGGYILFLFFSPSSAFPGYQTQSPSFNPRLWNWSQQLGPFICPGEEYISGDLKQCGDLKSCLLAREKEG